MSSQLWANYEQKIKAKREANKRKKATAGTEEKKRRLDSDHIIVQQLSSKVEGKAQKYSRIGPREFVSYKNSDVTIENLKQACQAHFSSKGLMEKGTAIDILAGERGPSCNELAQIPDLKIIHVRFVPRRRNNGDSDSDYGSHSTQNLSSQASLSCARSNRIPSVLHSRPLCAASLLLPNAHKQASFFPKSLSILTMLKLGKVASNESEVTVIDIFKLDKEFMTWSVLPVKAEFVVSKEHFGEGGFRRAYRATSSTDDFKGQEWVVKKYLPATLACLQETGQSAEDHSKKIVQTHMLAGNFAEQLRSSIATKCLSEFGITFSYNKVYMGRIESSSEYVTIEEFIEGKFRKYVNNDGTICARLDDIDLSLKAECLVHFSFHISNGELMLLDIQGAGMMLCDPEIASCKLLSEDNQYMYCAGNMSLQGIEKFKNSHTCNKYCQALALPAL